MNPYIKENEFSIYMIMLHWKLGGKLDVETIYGDSGDPISKILKKKMEVFKVPVIIPDQVYLLTSVLSNGNPGLAQLILRDILSDIKPLNKGHEVTYNDFMKTYNTKYIKKSFDFDNYFSTQWENQKTEKGTNKVDTVEFWMELFED